MSETVDHKILYEKLCDKLKKMRYWQKKKDQRLSYGVMLCKDDHTNMRRLEREVDNILLLDEDGKKIFQKVKS